MATTPTAIRPGPAGRPGGITTSSAAAMTTTTTRSRAGRSSVFQCGCSVSTLRSPSESWLSALIAHIVAWNRVFPGALRA